MASRPLGADGWHIRTPVVWVRIHREHKVSNKTEGIINTKAAVLALFPAMLDPRVSVAIAVVALAAMAVYHLRSRGGS